MVRQWYYSQNKQITGPISSSELKDLIRANKLRPSDLVQEEGTNRWHKVSVLKEKVIVPIVKSTEPGLDPGAEEPLKPAVEATDATDLKKYLRSLNSHPGVKKWLIGFICISAFLLAAWLVQWVININKDPFAEYEYLPLGRWDIRSDEQRKVLTPYGKQKAKERDQAAKDEKLRKWHEQMVQSGKVTDYRKPELSQHAYDSSSGIYSLHLIPDEWVRSETPKNQNAEIEFTLRGEECYSTVIAEQGEMSIQSLIMLSIKHFKERDPDAKIKQDIRRVNGSIIYCLHVNIKIEGLPLVMYGYYASCKKGTVQAVTWTVENLFEKHKPKMEEFLNGIVVTKD